MNALLITTVFFVQGHVLEGTPEEVLQESALKAFDKDSMETRTGFENLGTMWNHNWPYSSLASGNQYIYRSYITIYIYTI